MKKKQDNSKKNKRDAILIAALAAGSIGGGLLLGRHLNKKLTQAAHKGTENIFKNSGVQAKKVDLSSAKKVSKPDVSLPKDAYVSKVAFLKGFEKAAAIFSQGIVQGAKRVGKSFVNAFTGAEQRGFQQGAKTMVRQGMVGTGAGQVSKDAIRAQGAGIAVRKWTARGLAGAAAYSAGKSAFGGNNQQPQQPQQP